MESENIAGTAPVNSFIKEIPQTNNKSKDPKGFILRTDSGKTILKFVGNKPTRCLFSSESGSGADATKGTATPPPQKPSPPPSKAGAGTFDNTKYQCQEYYKHNEMSFYEVEISMTNKRVGQPSSKTK